MNHLKNLLKSILLAINASESMSDDSCLEIREDLFSALNNFTNMLEDCDEYETNKSLSSFDEVFNDAGWDGQGFRWEDGLIVYGELE